MKKFFSLVFLFASVSAFAEDPPVEFIQTYKASNAYAQFDQSDGGCIYGYAYVNPYRSTYQNNQETPVTYTFVYVNIQRYNQCTGAQELNAFGSAQPESLVFTKSGASVNANVEVYDQVSGSTILIQVNLAWNASGNRTNSAFNQNTTSPVGKLESTYKYTDKSTASSVSGSVSDGTNEYTQTNPYAYVSRFESKYVDFL